MNPTHKKTRHDRNRKERCLDTYQVSHDADSMTTPATASPTPALFPPASKLAPALKSVIATAFARTQQNANLPFEQAALAVLKETGDDGGDDVVTTIDNVDVRILLVDPTTMLVWVSEADLGRRTNAIVTYVNANIASLELRRTLSVYYQVVARLLRDHYDRSRSFLNATPAEMAVKLVKGGAVVGASVGILGALYRRQRGSRRLSTIDLGGGMPGTLKGVKSPSRPTNTTASIDIMFLDDNL